MRSAHTILIIRMTIQYDQSLNVNCCYTNDARKCQLLHDFDIRMIFFCVAGGDGLFPLLPFSSSTSCTPQNVCFQTADSGRFSQTNKAQNICHSAFFSFPKVPDASSIGSIFFASRQDGSP